MRPNIDRSPARIITYLAALAWLAMAAPASASPLDGLLSGPAGSNASSANSGAGASATSSGAGSPAEPTPVPFTQRLDVALTGAVSASVGSCQGTNCDSPGDCVAIGFQNVLAIGSAGPSTNGSSGMGASSSSSGSAAASSSRQAKAAGKSAIRTGGIAALQSLSACVNVDVDVQTPNGSGGVCMPASGIGAVNGQSFTVTGELCTDANPDGPIYSLNASYGMESQTPPGAGNFVEAIDANSGAATLLMHGTIGPGPVAVPAPASGDGPKPK
jgi:hypothetical protein